MTSVLILLSGFDPGTYFIEDDGIPANGIAQLRGPDGSVIFFNIPTEFLTVTASAGRSVVFNLTESFGAADINVGNLTNAAENPDSIQVRAIAGAGDVLLVSNGGVTEFGSDVAPDLIASTLIMSAQTGVGAGGNALETQVGTIEAETDTGGINITNIGTLTVGGLSTEVNGLFVGTSGNLTLVNNGGIDLNDETGFESIRGGNTSGNVVLTANGFDADIRSLVDIDSIAAPGGDIVLTAGRDVSLGTQGLNFDNDVRARGNLVINTGRDLNVDGFADLASDGFGAVTGDDVIVNAGRDINVLNSTGTDGSIGAEGSGGGNAILNAGPGGFVRLLATSASTLFSSTGNVEVNADRLVISATAGITASGGDVMIAPVTEGWDMDLGSVTDGAFALEISDAELDRIFTPDLSIGKFSAGSLIVSSGLTPAAATNLRLFAGTDLTFAANVTTTGLIEARAGDNLFQLGASAIVATSFSGFVDQVGDDGGSGGAGLLNGAITATPISLVGNAEADNLTGTGSNDSIGGLGGVDTLRGFGGNDILNGGTGIDTLDGGLGNDQLFVDALGDIVQEAVGEGTDRIFASATYVLGAGIEVETLSTTNNAGTDAINLTGNEIANTIFGNAGNNVLNGGGSGDVLSAFAGNDTLDGGTGIDTLIGGLGDDFLIVDSASDVVTEAVGEGNDRVFASVTYALAVNVQVETLSTTNSVGLDPINLVGNNLGNTLLGNNGNNILNGATGIDTLRGFAGNDSLYVDNAADQVFESVGGGVDRIFASVTYSMAAGQEVETLSTTNNAGVGAINLTGNELDNNVIGNAGANVLTGGGGNDTLQGLGGIDTFAGGLGDDQMVVDSATDVVQEVAGQGNDRVLASATYSLAAGVSVETLSTTLDAGTDPINLVGNDIANTLIGNVGNNILNGGSNNDVLQGLGGNDSLFVDSAADSVVELAGGGTDRVFASVSYALGGGEIETLSTTNNAGVTAINLLGNSLANSIIGNAGVNILNGGGGSDTLQGLGGADSFAFTNTPTAGNIDLVADFATGVDEILLENSVFTGLAAGALPANAFATGAAAADADDRVIYNPATGALFFDVDGTGATAQVQFATLSTGLAVTAGDFTVI